jgi:hypothetical protein
LPHSRITHLLGEKREANKPQRAKYRYDNRATSSKRFGLLNHA